MKRTLLNACVAILIGCLAMIPMPALARGGGGHGGGHGGGGHMGGHAGGYRGGYGHGGYGGRGYGRGYGGYGRYGGFGGYGGYGYGGFLGGLGWGWGYPYYGGYYGGWGYPYYSNYSSGYYPYYTDSGIYNYYNPYVIDNSAPYVATTPQTTAQAPALLEVVVPNPQARLWFDSTQTTSTGTDRLFETPPLAVGSTYTYHVRAQWMDGIVPVTVDRTVNITAGSRTVIDLSTPQATSSPSSNSAH